MYLFIFTCSTFSREVYIFYFYLLYYKLQIIGAVIKTKKKKVKVRWK